MYSVPRGDIIHFPSLGLGIWRRKGKFSLQSHLHCIFPPQGKQKERERGLMCEDLKALFSSRPKSAEIGTTDQRFPEQLSPSALWEMPRNPQRVLPAHPPAESTKRRRRLYAAKQRRCSSLALKPRPRPPPPHRSWDQASVSVDILASCSKSFEGKRREHINTTAVAGRKNCSYFLIDKTEGRSC